MPIRRHDTQPWGLTLDTDRATSAGYPLLLRIALLFIKGDWAEYAATLGFPTWHDAIRPCFAFNCALHNMYPTRIRRAALEREWRANEEEDYFVACQRCELEKELTDDGINKQLRAIMRSDKRKDG